MGINKAVAAADLLKKRIQSGVYDTVSFPGAPALAQELDISYVTMRKAMRILLDENIVCQLDNGRLSPVKSKTPAMKVAFITQPLLPDENKWVNAVRTSAEKFGCVFHNVIAVDSSSKNVFDILNADYDVIFMLFNKWHPLVVEKIFKIKERVVTVHKNFSAHGIRFFEGYAPEVLDTLYAYLDSRGYKKIDFFSSYKNDSSSWRYVQYLKAAKKYKFTGSVYFDVPEQIHKSRFMIAYDYCKGLVSAGKFKDTQAVFVSTPNEAQAVLRVFADAGIRVPEDISIVSIGEPEIAMYNTPTITEIGTPDLQEKSDEIFRHYLGITPQPEKLAFNHPVDALTQSDVLFIGETTK
ncbi:MAG: substrate-binding domain-containing protein [Lentisphaeria bacterium]|nr:substrate-binding domain-containing protein [Lentisphaeria bacterium]